MNYISTRGRMEPVGFLDAVMTGLAPDGGLLLPESLPDVFGKLAAWKNLSYQELAFEVMRLFATDIPATDLKKLIEKSYSTFRTPDVAPVIPVNGFHMLELWHGPTLAFKDVALQFLGNLFEYVLEKRGGELNILGATSGDTGSAAIYGVHGKKNIRIFIMHPKGRTSPVQEKQMTSVLDDNVFNLAVEGTFDDCQHLMKSIFSDVKFKEKHSLGSVNSVNWARVLAQIVYYFYAFFRVQETTDAAKVQFAVPTGNFGDIMAGWIAAQMGLPVKKLILATNENNILSRFFNTGTYSIGEVVSTLSPSMDIQVASNFERYLYYRLGQDAAKLRELMNGFAKNKTLTVPGSDDLFAAGEAGTAQTLAMIKKCYEQEGYILDPHTAVGVAVAEMLGRALSPKAPQTDRRSVPTEKIPTICLATAHPAKFNEAIQQAIGIAAHHPVLDKLANAETRCDTIANDEATVREYLMQKIVLYQFRRDGGIVTATVNGMPLPMENLAEAGFAWGDSSDSARNLAYSILKHARGEAIARMFVGDLVGDVLSRLTIDRWCVSARQVEEYVDYRCAIGAVSQSRNPTVKIPIHNQPQFLGNVNESLGCPSKNDF